MGKVLLVVILAFVIYALWRGGKRKADVQRPGSTPGGAAGGGRGGKPGEPERMVSCERCKVHLPLGEAVIENGRYFCSEEHARLTGTT